MPRTPWTVLLAAALTGCTYCSAPPEPGELGGPASWDEPDDDALGARTPWLGRDAVNVAGRVVSPAGEPLGAMKVELVYPGDPHWPETVAFTSLTDDDGRFVFRDVCSHCFALVVRGSGGALTYRERLPLGEDFEVVYAPVRRVPVRVHCAVAPSVDRSRREPRVGPPHIRVDWLPDRGTVANVYLPAADEGAELSGDYLSSILPGWTTTLPRIGADARHFGAMVPLPEGELRVLAISPCGVVSRVFRVPDEPIELRLPTDDHARLSVHRAASALGAPLRVDLVFERMQLGGDELGAFGRTVMEADWLAPGEYTIAGDDWRCRVALRPRTHARVAASRQGCEVEEEPL